MSAVRESTNHSMISPTIGIRVVLMSDFVKRKIVIKWYLILLAGLARNIERGSR